MQTYDGDVLWKEGIRDSIFIAMSGNDKDDAMPLIRALNALNINHYAMFLPDGTNENRAGVDHRVASEDAMKRSCLFIWLLSADSIDSSAIINELKLAKENGFSEIKNNDMSPIMLFSIKGKTIKDVDNDVRAILSLDSAKICDPLGDASSDDLKKAITAIQERYVRLRSAGLKELLEDKNNARKFSTILSKSMSPMNDIKRIENDIKECAEGTTDDLLEMHVLTNELVSYDANPYSCVAIANNLLGPCTEENTFCPSKRGFGVKYFYYMTKRSKNEQFNDFREKIGHYLKKDKFSRQEVLYEIRKSYYTNLRLSDWIGAMTSDAAETFILQLGVDKKNDELIQQAITILSSADSINNNTFSFPSGFINWIKGEKIDRRMVQATKTFINAIGEVIRLIDQQNRPKSFDFLKLKQRYIEWDLLFVLGEWQLGESPWPVTIDGKTLSDGEDLLDFVEGLPSLKNNNLVYEWMRFSEDDSGLPYVLQDGIVEDALANLHCIEVDESKMDLVYSFAFLITTRTPQCTWYTTGRYFDNSTNSVFGVLEKDRETVMVTSYTTEHYQDYVDAFSYLIRVNGKENILKNANSYFYERYLKQD